jgi:hypothetical protein
MVVVRTFDPACQDLAEHFLLDEPNNKDSADIHAQRVRSLSVAIQQAIEDWHEDHPYPKEGA